MVHRSCILMYQTQSWRIYNGMQHYYYGLLWYSILWNNSIVYYSYYGIMVIILWNPLCGAPVVEDAKPVLLVVLPVPGVQLAVLPAVPHPVRALAMTLHTHSIDRMLASRACEEPEAEGCHAWALYGMGAR